MSEQTPFEKWAIHKISLSNWITAEAAWNEATKELTARITALETEKARLVDGIQKVIDGDYLNPRASRSTTGKCRHGVWYYEDCDSCTTEALENLIASASAQSAAWLENSRREWMKGLRPAAWCFGVEDGDPYGLNFIGNGYPLFALPKGD